MKNLSIILFCFISFSCKAQKTTTFNMQGETYKVISKSLNDQNQFKSYVNEKNKFYNTRPGYGSDYTEQYFDQNLVKVNEQKVLTIVREVINGKIKADKTQSLIINFYLNPSNGKVMELAFTNFYKNEEITQNIYIQLEKRLLNEITADIKTDRYKKYPYVQRTLLLNYADLARQE
jgi:hypothetical protein